MTNLKPACLLFLAAGLLTSACALTAEQFQWRDVPKVVAFSDVHGAYDELTELLSELDLIDADQRWIGGDTHLVSTGDLLDRGADSRAVMDLLMSLQTQAQEAGGRVHVVLGNHELMNLYGDLRYVIDGEYQAYAGDQDTALRNQAMEEWLEAGKLTKDFEDRYPVGFFSHRELFRPEGKYGKWIAGLPFVIVVNNTAFAHGGLSEAVIGRDLVQVNQVLGDELNAYLDAWLPLRDAGVVTIGDDFWGRYDVVATWLKNQTDSSELTQAAERFLKTENSWLFGDDNPHWYRGNLYCSPIFQFEQTQKALAGIGATRLVVGHTPTRGEVRSHLRGSVIALDTGMAPYYNGRPSALIMDGDQSEVYYADDNSYGQPSSVPRQLGPRPGGLSDDDLEHFLSSAEVVETNELQTADGESTLVSLSDGKHRVRGIFRPGKNMNEVVAYRLDRKLGLGLVPVTVPREINGESGWLRFFVEGVVTEKERQEKQLRGTSNCPLQAQYDLMNTFDALIFNEGRNLNSIQYEKNSWDLLLVDHDRAFKSKSGRPRHLKEAPLFLNETLVGRLEALDADTLSADFEDLLSKSQIKGMIKRRNQILKKR